MLTLNRLDAIDADRLHRKLGLASRPGEERLARRRYRLSCRVYLHLHRALLRNQLMAPRRPCARWDGQRAADLRKPWALQCAGRPAARMASDMKFPKPLTVNGLPHPVTKSRQRRHTRRVFRIEQWAGK
jgi:hypothetical protein